MDKKVILGELETERLYFRSPAFTGIAISVINTFLELIRVYCS